LVGCTHLVHAPLFAESIERGMLMELGLVKEAFQLARRPR
jgi:hypothetical protein